MLVAPAAVAAPIVLSTDVEYQFVDQNGLGWARISGRVSITITLAGTGGSLVISGAREWFDARLVESKPPRPNPDLTGDKWKGQITESYPLHEVTIKDRTISFKLDPGHDHLTGSCTPTKVDGLPSTALYECTITGFQWHTIANLPELHHPILFDADPTAKLRVLNSMTGKTKAGSGSRAVSLRKPMPPVKPASKP